MKKISVFIIVIIVTSLICSLILKKYCSKPDSNEVIINGIKYIYEDKTRSYSVDSVVDENITDIKISNIINNYPVTKIHDSFLSLNRHVDDEEKKVDLNKTYNIYIPKNIEKIGNGCFVYAKMKIEFELNSKLKYIGKSSFKSCILDYVSLPEGLLYIDRYAFSYSSIDKIIIPNSIKEIDLGFYELKTTFNELEGIRYLGNDENPYLLLHSVVDTEMINCNIKDGTKYILFSAFQHCKKLEKLNIPSTVIIIPKHSFIYCSNLKEVKIHSNIKYIEYEAFSGSDGLTIILEHNEIPKTFNKWWITGENYTIILNNGEVIV